MMIPISVLHMSLPAAMFLAPLAACPPEDETAATEATVYLGAAGEEGDARFLADRALRALTLVNGDGQETRTITKVVIQNENGELCYTDENGNVWVTHNGEGVPAERVQHDGGVLRVVDDEGNTLYEIHLAYAGQFMQHGGEGHGEPQIGAFMGHAPDGVAFTAPRGRIGIYLSPLDPERREALGIDNEAAIVVAGVIEGTPAEAAGLQVDDVIVRVNGQSVSEDSLRSIISETTPGDAVVLRIVRAGDAQDVRVEVQEVAGEEFEIAVEGELEALPAQDVLFRLEGLDGRMHELHDHLLQLAPEGEWRRHIEQIDPEMLENLRVRFGEGQEFFQLHVQPHLEGHGEWREHLEGHQGAIREKIIEALQNVELDIDDETRGQIEISVREALENALGNVEDFEFQWQGAHDQPMMFDFVEQGEGGHVMVLPEGGAWQMMPHGEGIVPGGGGPAEERLQRLEERLQRLEALLERLVQQHEGDNDRP